SHGGALIDALARHGDGLPANVLPLAVNEVTQVGLEAIAAAFAYGAGALRLLLRARTRHDVSGLLGTLALAEPILAGLGYRARGRRGRLRSRRPIRSRWGKFCARSRRARPPPSSRHSFPMAPSAT